MKGLTKLLDFYIYSSIHIALGASLSVLLCYAAFSHIPTSDYPIFVFASTLFLYGIHRIVGINKVKAFETEGRFAVIKRFKTHLVLYSIIARVGCLYIYITLDRQIQLLLLLPIITSILYVLPIFQSGKRLRDYNFIKIFLITINWVVIIGLIPYIEAQQSFDVSGLIYCLEKGFFIFAITLPFDVRDLKVDQSIEVSTLPTLIGVEKSYRLSYILMILTIICVGILYFLEAYTLKLGIGLTIAYLATIFLIKLSKNKSHDYYYSGLLDGSIALVALIGIALSGILSVLF